MKVLEVPRSIYDIIMYRYGGMVFGRHEAGKYYLKPCKKWLREGLEALIKGQDEKNLAHK